MSKSRRDALRSLGLAGIALAATATAAVATSGPVCAQPNSDAELLRLWEEMKPRLVTYRILDDEARVLGKVFDPNNAAFARGLISEGEFFQRRHACGLEAAAVRSDAAFLRCEQIAAAIRDLPATTMAGLIVKIHALAFDAAIDEREMLGPEDDMNWEPLVFCRLIRELEEMATQGLGFAAGRPA